MDYQQDTLVFTLGPILPNIIISYLDDQINCFL